MPLSGSVAATPPQLRDHGFHLLKVARVVEETAEATSFVLDIPDELRPAFAYQSGQFCTFRVPVDGQAHVRCYSMSSAPAVDTDLRVTVKRVPDGLVSNWMIDHLGPGDPVEVSPPAGFFRLDDSPGDVVAFAAGSGITPILSLLKTAAATTTRRVRLLYANRDEPSVIFAAELAGLGARHGDRVTVVHHLDVAQGFVGPDDVRAFAAGAGGGGTFYVCGPGPFMDTVEGALLASGVDLGRIHIERFTPPDQPPPAAPGAGPSLVTIELGGRSATAEHRAGTTILQTARQLGLDPPFSCEAGSCATCMARLAEGTVSMYANNALTDDEVAAGWVLTCQAVPTSPVVRVDYDSQEG